MDFERMLLNRESCRTYRNEPVPREALIKICEAGRLTPSGCNAQPWKFMVVDEPDAKARLCDALLVEGRMTGAPWREDCPAFIVLVEQKATLVPAALEYYKDPQRYAQGDIAMASLNMCYQAMDLGLSSCILGMIDRRKMQTLFGIPAEEEVRLVVAIGYSEEERAARPKKRKAFEDVVCFNEWK